MRRGAALLLGGVIGAGLLLAGRKAAPAVKASAQKVKTAIHLPPVSLPEAHLPAALTPKKTAATGTRPLIVVDPGHGLPDPGTHSGVQTEAGATLATARTLARLLESQGFDVELTRGITKPPGNDQASYGHRTNSRPRQVCLVSVHYNAPGLPALVYRQADPPRADSARLAAVIARAVGNVPVWDSTSSRFGRLFIDNCVHPAALWEVAGIEHYQNSEAWRERQCAPVAFALRDWHAGAGTVRS